MSGTNLTHAFPLLRSPRLVFYDRHTPSNNMDDTTWTDIAAVEGANVDDARPDTDAPCDGGVRSFLNDLGIGEHADAIIAEGYDTLDGITNDLALDDLLADDGRKKGGRRRRLL